MSSVRNEKKTTLLVLLLVVAAVLWRPASAHVRAASFLMRFAHPDAPGWLGDAGRHDVTVSETAVAGTRARLYVPQGVSRPPGLVIAHGVHWKGIDDPRLERFATLIASSGIEVLTPEIAELCDYRIEPASVDTIGRSALAFSEQLGGRRVGVMGLSFAGGLSLVAASDARYEPAMSFVAAVGAHDDLGRVLRFFLTDEAPRPDGSAMHRHAHDYGTVVLEYDYVDQLFPPEDVEAARGTLRAILHEDFDAAHRRAQALSPPSAARMDRIFAHDTAALAPELLALVDRLEPRFAAVSPSAHVSRLRVPAFVLHGAGDYLIPPTEADWLAHDVPRATLRGVLVSDAIEHVGLEGDTKASDELALVHFMGDLFEAEQAE